MTGNLTRKQFDVLAVFNKGNCNFTQRQLAEKTGISLGTINSIIRDFTNDGLISNGQITDKGFMALQTYKVDNAIIMAAGMSSRFAPLSYEIPKGLLKVKGEILIERQIRQLQEAGITDITVIVGYMKEKFFYLKEKFGVDIIVNEDYYRFNNPSTLIKVLDRIGNTYICSSDNYFTSNVFEQYVYGAYYAATFFSGNTNETGVKVNRYGIITQLLHSVHDEWCLLGHAYFSKEFSEKFKTLLLENYDKGDTKTKVWERLYEKNTDKLRMYVRKYAPGTIYEFDSLDELREFDSKYIENTGSKIFKNICNVLNCKESSIQNINVIKHGLTNLSFSFSVDGVNYVYRHPGAGTDNYISRKSEVCSMQMINSLELDKTHIYISEDGWKLSRYIENNHMLDYADENEVSRALALLKKLHDAKLKSKYSYDMWQKTCKLIAEIPSNRKDFKDFKELYSDIHTLYKLTENDKVEKVLCHGDCYAGNFLIDDSNNISLIDWEYSGNNDPASDVATFICCSEYTFDEVLKTLGLYYGRQLSAGELKHSLAYIAIASYHWYVWAIYMDSLGNNIGERLLHHYKNTKMYMKKALEMYKA